MADFSLSSSSSFSSSSSHQMESLTTTGSHFITSTTSTQLASASGPPSKDVEEKEKELHSQPQALKSLTRFSSTGSSSSSSRIRQSVIAEGLLNHDFFMSHVASFLDPFCQKYTRKSLRDNSNADGAAQDALVPLLSSEAAPVSFPSSSEASASLSLLSPPSPSPPLSSFSLPPLPKVLKSQSTRRQGSDLLKLCILSKAFNEAVTSNEPIWQNILRNLMAPTVTIALPCNVLADKTAFYKFMLSKIKGFESYPGMRDFKKVMQNKTSQTTGAVTYSGFLSKRSSLKSILQTAEKGLRSSFSCLLPRNHSSASISKAKTVTCMVCTSVEGIEGSLLDLLEETELELNKNLFPSFDQIPTHSFSAACKKCPFRIDVSVESLKNECECNIHDDLIHDLLQGGEDLEDLVIKVCENRACLSSLYCQYCCRECTEDGCDEIMCSNCEGFCVFCERAPLCAEHNFICQEDTCDKPGICRECVIICVICASSSCEDHVYYCNYCNDFFCLQHEYSICDSCGNIACGRYECIVMGSHPQHGSQIQLCATEDCGASFCETCANECGSCLRRLCEEHSQFCEKCHKFYCESCALVTRDEVTTRADKSLSTCSICNPNRPKHLITDYFKK